MGTHTRPSHNLASVAFCTCFPSCPLWSFFVVCMCFPNCPLSITVCVQGMARGALVTALGLSNQALFDEEVEGATGGHLPQHTTEGPDIAPHAAPRVLTGAAMRTSALVVPASSRTGVLSRHTLVL